MKSQAKKKVNVKKKKKGNYKFEMPKWMECGWRRVGCGRDDCPLCGRIKKDRQGHIEKGEDPDSWKSVFEDVSRNFKEVLEAIKQDAKQRGIDITNIDDIKEPPEPEEFLLYNKAHEWRKFVCAILEEAADSGELWLDTEVGQDLSWYSSLLLGKIYRQLSNRWEMDHGDAYGEFDYEYTQKVIKESLKIIKQSLQELISYDTGQRINLMLAQSRLVDFENEILKI